MIPTLDGRGYWLIASDGGVFAYGDAPVLRVGRRRQPRLSRHRRGTRSYLGGGYWMVDANGQVLNFGDARFEGQPAEAPGGYRITGMAGTQSSNGYWLASANGNVADFGNAAPYGSMIGTASNAPVVGMATTHDGAGYWLQGSDGGIFTFGDAQFYGSMGGRTERADGRHRRHLRRPATDVGARTGRPIAHLNRRRRTRQHRRLRMSQKPAPPLIGGEASCRRPGRRHHGGEGATCRGQECGRR